MSESNELRGQSPPTDASGASPVDDPSSNQVFSTWETLGKLILPASIACYFVGFLVAVPHFAKSGVPVDAISLQTFLAAGLLFFTLTVATAISGVALRKEFARKTGTCWKTLWGGVSKCQFISGVEDQHTLYPSLLASQTWPRKISGLSLDAVLSLLNLNHLAGRSTRFTRTRTILS